MRVDAGSGGHGCITSECWIGSSLMERVRKVAAVVIINGGIMALGVSTWGQSEGAALLDTTLVGLVGVVLIVVGVWLWKNRIST